MSSRRLNHKWFFLSVRNRLIVRDGPSLKCLWTNGSLIRVLQRFSRLVPPKTVTNTHWAHCMWCQIPSSINRSRKFVEHVGMSVVQRGWSNKSVDQIFRIRFLFMYWHFPTSLAQLMGHDYQISRNPRFVKPPQQNAMFEIQWFPYFGPKLICVEHVVAGICFFSNVKTRPFTIAFPESNVYVTNF